MEMLSNIFIFSFSVTLNEGEDYLNSWQKEQQQQQQILLLTSEVIPKKSTLKEIIL